MNVQAILRRLFVAAALVAAATAGTVPAGAQDIALVSGTVTGSWFTHMTVLGERVFKPAGFNYSNKPGGGTSNVIAVSTGRADLGFTMPLVIGMAANGEAPFKDKITNVSVIAALYPDPWEAVVPAESGINTYKDLKGKTVVGAPPGQLADVTLLDILKLTGIEKDVRIRQASQSEGVALVKDRHADMFGWIAPLPNSNVQDLALARSLKWLEFTDEELAKLIASRDGYLPHVIKAGTYASLTKDIKTVQTPVVLVVNNKMSDEMAYKLTKALVDHIEALRESGPSDLKAVQPKDLAAVGKAPMHPGAAKFYREIKALP